MMILAQPTLRALLSPTEHFKLTKYKNVFACPYKEIWGHDAKVSIYHLAVMHGISNFKQNAVLTRTYSSI